MKIRSLNINQYKSLKDLKLDNLFDVNIFIGPNNSGKSNILDGIESLFLPFDSSGFFADKEADYSFDVELDEEARTFFNTSAEILTAKRLGGAKRYFLDNVEVED